MFYGNVRLFQVVQAVQVFFGALSRVVYVASDRFKEFLFAFDVGRPEVV